MSRPIFYWHEHRAVVHDVLPLGLMKTHAVMYKAQIYGLRANATFISVRGHCRPLPSEIKDIIRLQGMIFVEIDDSYSREKYARDMALRVKTEDGEFSVMTKEAYSEACRVDLVSENVEGQKFYLGKRIAIIPTQKAR